MKVNPEIIKSRHIMVLAAMVMLWEFSFPQIAVASEIAVNQNQPPITQTETILPVTGENQSPDRLPDVPLRPQPLAKRTMRIAVTAYSSTVDQCGSDPFTTASGTTVRDGVIAANFLPIGTKVRFPDQFGNKIFVVEDRMSARYWQRADIWMPSREEAKQWGIQHITIEIL